MTIGMVLTVVLFAAKYIFGQIQDWPVWQLFLPMIIELAIELTVAVLFGSAILTWWKTRNRRSRSSDPLSRTTWDR